MPSPLKQLQLPEFPALLREIPDPPNLLYMRGTTLPEESKYLCIVGSRKATSYGKEVCRELISGLRGYDLVIVSGLALSIDATAHEMALDAGLHALAVPGSGLNDESLYPRTNLPLAQRILKSGGTLVSEFPPDYRARPESFPRRNRIMAGLSHAVLVIEAEIRSGTLITARLATEYNRDVLTVPGSIFSSASAGPHMLMRLGATPVQNTGDILEALHTDPIPNALERTHETLSGNEQQVWEALKEPQSRDMLIEALAIPAQEANVLLSSMELRGLIVEQMGSLRRGGPTP